MDGYDERSVAEALAEARGYLAGLAHRDRCTDSGCLCRPPAEAPAADPYASPRRKPWVAMQHDVPKHADDDTPLSEWK